MSVFRDLLRTENAEHGAQSGSNVELTVELLVCIEAHCGPRGAWRSVKGALIALAEECTLADAHASSSDVLRWLFANAEFVGNREFYRASSNSMLSEVLRTRRGIPISLCVVAQAVLAHLGFESHLIGLPGHVVLGMGGRSHEAFVDCFNSGRELSQDQCVALAGVATVAGASVSAEQFMKPMSPALVALRTLNNLVGSFESERDAVGLARAAALRLTVPLLAPDDVRSTLALLAHTN